MALNFLTDDLFDDFFTDSDSDFVRFVIFQQNQQGITLAGIQTFMVQNLTQGASQVKFFFEFSFLFYFLVIGSFGQNQMLIPALDLDGDPGIINRKGFSGGFNDRKIIGFNV